MQPVYWFVAEVNPRNAGYRVRTLPIVTELRAQGLNVELRPLAEMPELAKEVATKALAVVVSKPGDTATHLCMRYIGARRVPVVLDLFDNYFSWSPALVARQLHWQWLRSLQSASIVMTSSSYLRRVIESLSAKPVVEVGDEVSRSNSGLLGSPGFERKWAACQRVELLWFGISGNPYYQAGLEDLARWSGVVRGLIGRMDHAASVRLTICTNRVPAVDAVLADLRAQQIDARFVEWTEEGCDALLDASHVVLLPTSLSGFSLSKTHNRCTDALLRGCLVLSSPNGPYMDVPGAVFDDPDLLATVLARTNADGVRQLIDASFTELRRRHDLAADTARLKQALLAAHESAARAPAVDADAPYVLVTARVKAEVPKFSRTLGYLVAGFADSPLQLNYDFRLESLAATGGLPTITLSERGWSVVEGTLARRVEVDLQDFDDSIECSMEGWRLRLVRRSRELVVTEGLDRPSIATLHQAQLNGRGTSPTQIAAWFEPHVDIITKIIWQIGLRNIDLATEDEGGWDSLATNADPVLAALRQRLQQNWVRYHGNEVAWGRPVGEPA